MRDEASSANSNKSSCLVLDVFGQFSEWRRKGHVPLTWSWTPPLITPLRVSLISSAYQPGAFCKSSHLTLGRLFKHLLIPPLFRGLPQTTGGVSQKAWTKTFVSSYIATIAGNIWLVSGAEPMGRWIGVFGGGRKEMLSRLNEGRFTQNNEGWTHGFTADVYLKRPGKYCFGTEGFICRYTYPLQPLAPTWGPELSLGSLLFLFFLSERIEKCDSFSAELFGSWWEIFTEGVKIWTSADVVDAA